MPIDETTGQEITQPEPVPVDVEVEQLVTDAIPDTGMEKTLFAILDELREIKVVLTDKLENIASCLAIEQEDESGNVDIITAAQMLDDIAVNAEATFKAVELVAKIQVMSAQAVKNLTQQTQSDVPEAPEGS